MSGIMNKKKVMCIVPANLQSLKDKGVDGPILQRDLGGYWDKVYTVHPFCDKEAVYELSDKHVVLEFRLQSLPLTILKLAKLIKREKITAIKAHDPHFTGPMAWMLSRLCGIPYVVGVYSSYDLMLEVYKHPQLGLGVVDRWVAHFTLSNAAMVLGGSADITKWALRSGARPDKIETARSGVAKEHFEEPEGRAKQDMGGRRVLLYVGRLDPVKFPQDAVKCVLAVRETIKDAILVVAGEGPMREELEALAGPSAVFLGFVRPPQVLINLMASADVILTPLSGSSLVEAALAAKPIVAYDVDWHGELIKNGETGVLVPFRDYKAMAAEVVKLLQDGQRARLLGENAKHAALAMHRLDVLYRQESTCFDRALGEVHGA